jgi:hypothetical protein
MPQSQLHTMTQSAFTQSFHNYLFHQRGSFHVPE